MTGLSGADTKLFKFNIADATLVSTVFEFIGSWQTKFLSDEIVTDVVFGITGQVVVFLFVQYFLKGSIK